MFHVLPFLAEGAEGVTDKTSFYVDTYPPNRPPHISISAETLFTIGDPNSFFHLPVTNSMLNSIVAALIVFTLGLLVARAAKPVPGRGQSLWESIIEFLLSLVEGAAGKKVGRQIFPFIATAFVYILTANWLGVLPFFGDSLRVRSAVSGELVPLFRAANADLNSTLALAIVAVIAVQIWGIRAHGVGGHFKHFLNPLHAIDEVSHLISLSARLFGNVFGGEVLVSIMYFLLGSLFVGFGTVIFLGLELFFGVIQALVFSFLSLLYISLATQSEHPEEHEGAHGPTHDLPESKAVPYEPQSVPGN